MSLTLQPLLRSRYRRDTWTTILRDLFPDGSITLLATPSGIDAPHDSVTVTRQLGNLQLADGSRVALVEVEAADSVKLARNRIALRNFIGKLIVPGSSDAVLAVFHQPGRDDWRLTYASRRTTLDPETFAVTHSETSPRRFTFLLGPGETCRTAAGRLKELEGKDKLTLDELERAFSVERLNKDFFKRYKEFYERFTAHLLSSDKALATRKAFGIKPEADPKEQDKADKPVRDFSKKLLGRLVFLHFLQRKRWLGCPKGTTDWSGGEENFIADFFGKAQAAGEADQFHSKYLTPLFFEALNTPDRKGDLFPLTGTRLPYLNGGLFEEDAPALRALDFPPLLFEELLGFFGEYHFTIDENDPEDHEVGIDPEMLGHIFENLLEDNKDKGAFYTPKAIVQYMARESLRHYLETHLGPDPEIAILLAEKDLTRLDKNGFVKQHAKKIATLLEDVKICDPAIGSGAFPIGLLQEILWTRLTLNWELNTPEDRARLKREIIKNSIHGVDLDPGAVEIARLRFWLALVVDEEIPRPLPNLDYKIMQGDGLLESFEGIDLSRIASGHQASYAITELLGGQGEFSLDDAKTQMELQVTERSEKIAAMLRDYFSETDPVRKKQRHTTIDAEVLKHLDHAIGFERDRINGLLDQQRKMLAGKIARTKSWTKQKGERLVEIYRADLAALEQKAAKLRTLQQSTERPFFLWHLYFQEVFENGGFDIVLANPPYVRQETIREYKPLLKREGYECFTGTADLFVYFYEQAVNLLRPGGTLTFITSNKYYRAGYGEKLRPFLTQNLTLRTLIDFGDAPVFDAIAYASILIGTKATPPADHSLHAYSWQVADAIGQLPQTVEKGGIALAQTDLAADGWRLESPASIKLLAKIRKTGMSLRKTLGNQVYRGVTTGMNDAFVINEETKKKIIQEDPSAKSLIKPYLRGKDIKRWTPESSGLFLIFTRHGTDISKHKSILKHLSGFREQLEPEPKNWAKGKWPGRKEGNYKWHEIQDQTAYWPELEKVKIVSTKVSITPTFAIEKSGSYLGNTSYCVAIEPQHAYVVAILNSLLSFYYCKKVFVDKQNGYFEVQPDGLEDFPIPAATPEEQARLATLAERAAGFAKSGDKDSLRATEREIDGIVYQLFHLTPAEIALIEEAVGGPVLTGTHGFTKEKDALFRRLRGYANSDAPYVSIDKIREDLEKEGLKLSPDLLREYLSEAMAQGVIHDAGRGWYSPLGEAASLDPSPVRSLVEDLRTAFPLLDFTAWATTQLNPWMRHLFNSPLRFVSCPKEGLDVVYEFLKRQGEDVWLNPRKADIPNFVPTERAIVLRASVSKAPSEPPFASVEQVLIDLCIERRSLPILDESEFQSMAGQIAASKRLKISELESYSKRRKVLMDEIFSKPIFSTISKKVEKIG